MNEEEEEDEEKLVDDYFDTFERREHLSAFGLYYMDPGNASRLIALSKKRFEFGLSEAEQHEMDELNGERNDVE